MALFRMKPWYKSRKKVLSKYGTTTLSSGRRNLAATSIGDYAIFSGGTYRVGDVDAFNSLLTRSKIDTSCYYSDLAAASIGDYAIFGGGDYYNDSSSSSSARAYDRSLTKNTSVSLTSARRNLAATSVGDYALFGGGYANTRMYYDTVDVFNRSLTRSSATKLYNAVEFLAATSVGDYALFGGGRQMNAGNIVTAYNTSLTRTIPNTLSESRMQLAATSVGDYALFGGGWNGSGGTGVRKTVEAYDTSLVHTEISSLSSECFYLAAASLEDYALFGGGSNYSSSGTYTQRNAVNVYDSSLVRTNTTPLGTSRGMLAATTVGNFIIFAGGGNQSGSSYNSVDVYQVA